MSERRIGKVTSVDSFRVIVQLDSDVKSLYKSGFNDIYEIARINSYIIIPIGSDRIIAIITRVKIQDETELEKSSGSIMLPKAERYLIATMLGTIEEKNGKSEYLQGVYNFPILDNPVWYIVKDDLEQIFDTTQGNSIDYSKDYYLPIGISPSFSDYEIKINPDKLFAKHSAILGNTGSGKSCTVATLLQSLFKYKYPDEKYLKSSNIIIFDTNGEYSKAFVETEKTKEQIPKSTNTFHISSEDLKIPYWFMNYDDFDYLFQPSALTQAPILKNAISLARDFIETDNETITYFLNSSIQNILDSSIDNLKKIKYESNYGQWDKFRTDNDILGLAEALKIYRDPLIKTIQDELLIIGGNNSIPLINESLIRLKSKYNEYNSKREKNKVNASQNIDLPKYFSFEDLILKFIEHAIEDFEGSSSKIRENVSTLKLRMQSYFNDERIASPLLLNMSDKRNIEDEQLLSKFIMFLLGYFFEIPKEKLNDIFADYYTASNTNKEMKNQITIIDLSLLPYEVLETVTGLIGRIILEFANRINKVHKNKERGVLPIVLILEEAQNYIPEKDRTDRISISKKVFERIAREGRKFGVSLIISSQRPSELSKTVLSQCNSFIIHRLQNPDDQKYIRQLVSSANEDILQQLPILPQQQAIIMGDAVRTPIQVKINDANPKPDSENPKFIEKWLEDPSFTFDDFSKVTSSWINGGIENKSDNSEGTTG